MRRKFAWLALSLCLCSPAHSALAQSDGDDPTIVDELVVRAPQHGPAWWRVSRGESVVFILGMPSAPLPRGSVWDTATIERRLRSAHTLILPPVSDLTPGQRIQFQQKITSGYEEDALPEDLRVRLVRAREGLGVPKEALREGNLRVIALTLSRVFLDRNRLTTDEPLAAIEAIARRLDVRNERAEVRAAPPQQTGRLAREAEISTRAAAAEARVCLDGVLDDIEVGATRYAAAAVQWAEGDVGGAIAGLPLQPKGCLAPTSWRRDVADYSAAIERALRRPGNAVAPIPLRLMVIRDGVVETLRKRGYRVEDPASFIPTDLPPQPVLAGVDVDLASAAGKPPAAEAAEPASRAEATEVSELIVSATSLRPESDAPRFTVQQLQALSAFAERNFTAALVSEGRGERALVTTFGARGSAENPSGRSVIAGMPPSVGATRAEQVGSQESTIRIAGVTAAADGRKRALYRQLQRAAETAEKATAAAEAAFAVWVERGGSRDHLLAAERARAKAVRDMLEAREQAMQGVESAEEQQWASIIQIASESANRMANYRFVDGDAAVTRSSGVSDADQEAIFTAMDRREYERAAETARRTLRFENVAAAPVPGDIPNLVRVSGEIRNKADVTAEVPPFNVVFYDQDDKPFGGAVVQLEGRGIPSNGSRRFSLDVASDQARISRVAIIFGPAGR